MTRTPSLKAKVSFALIIFITIRFVLAGLKNLIIDNPELSDELEGKIKAKVNGEDEEAAEA